MMFGDRNGGIFLKERQLCSVLFSNLLVIFGFSGFQGVLDVD